MPTPSATLILRGLPGYQGEANLYRLDPPLQGHDEVIVTTSHAGRHTHRPVTAIHAADGTATWLPGSKPGTYGHHAALIRAGYRRITDRALAPRCLWCGMGSGNLIAVTPDVLSWRCQQADCGGTYTSDRAGLVGGLRKAARRARELAAQSA